MHRHRHVILHLIAKFQIVISIFFKMAAGSHTGFDLGIVRSAIAGLSFFLKIAIFARAVFVVFRLNVCSHSTNLRRRVFDILPFAQFRAQIKLLPVVEYR